MGRLILELDLVPQLILSSTAKRARKTAKLVAEACNYEGEIRLQHELYHAGPMGYIRVLQGLDDVHQRVMIIGHNPGLEVLLEVLTGVSEWLPTAALAQMRLPVDAWSGVKEYIDGDLVGLWTPKGLHQKT
jgi:phosphohistidine phosphatase